MPREEVTHCPRGQFLYTSNPLDLTHCGPVDSSYLALEPGGVDPSAPYPNHPYQINAPNPTQAIADCSVDHPNSGIISSFQWINYSGQPEDKTRICTLSPISE